MKSETEAFNKQVLRGLAPKQARSIHEVLVSAGLVAEGETADAATLNKARKALNAGIEAGTVAAEGQTRSRKYTKAPKAA